MTAGMVLGRRRDGIMMCSLGFGFVLVASLKEVSFFSQVYVCWLFLLKFERKWIETIRIMGIRPGGLGNTGLYVGIRRSGWGATGLFVGIWWSGWGNTGLPGGIRSGGCGAAGLRGCILWKESGPAVLRDGIRGCGRRCAGLGCERRNFCEAVVGIHRAGGVLFVDGNVSDELEDGNRKMGAGLDFMGRRD